MQWFKSIEYLMKHKREKKRYAGDDRQQLGEQTFTMA
jgi:hypothetical protein